MSASSMIDVPAIFYYGLTLRRSKHAQGETAILTDAINNGLWVSRLTLATARSGPC